jgi:Ca2+-binding EF-hand superfamily protein
MMISSVGSSNALSQMAEMRQKMFSKIDTNGDGKHDKDELTAMVANGPQNGMSVDQILSDFDTDGDGAVSETEFEAGPSGNSAGSPPPPAGTSGMSSADFINQIFSTSDTNGDGEIDSDELSQMSANAPEGAPSAETMLSELDTDGSGTISQSEFEAGAPSSQQAQGPMGPPPSSDDIFSKLDTDGDGSISKSEFEAGTSSSAESTSSTTTKNSNSQNDLTQMLAAALKSYAQISSASWLNGGEQGSSSSLYA